MKGLSQSEAAEIIGISRVTVSQHVQRVLFFKKNVPGKWFKIFNIIQSVTK
jgi:DNA-directed RNA polymerase specialized sigma subunit, sigma24 homolog